MEDRYPTPATPDRFAFDVLVDGTSIGIDLIRNVIEIDVDERVNSHAVAQILLNNWDPTKRAVRYSDDGPFLPGVELEIKVGYHTELRSVFAGVVTGLTVSFTASSIPGLVVDCRSKSIYLAGSSLPRSYEDLSDVDIVNQIAAAHGLSANVEEALRRETLVEPEMSDWERVVWRARRYGWVAYTRGNTLRLGPPSQLSNPIKFKHAQNLLEFRMSEDLTNRHDPVDIGLWDPAAQAVVEAEQAAESLDLSTGSRPTLTSALHGFGSDDTGPETRGWPETGDQTAADLLASGEARRQALSHITAEAVTIGTPDLRIDQWVEIEGGGERFRGPHYVSEVRHRIGRGGYTTEFQTGLRPLLEPGPQQPLPTIGATVAVVEDLNDPNGWGRVKVGFPWLGEGVSAVWARLALLDAGDQFGTLFVPEVGQEVVVTQITGSGDLAVLGCLWNGQAAPPEAIEADANDVRSIVSKTGHRIRFDDGAKTAEIASADGRVVKLDDNEKSVTISEKEGNSIVMDSSGITLTAKRGDITIKADSGDVKISGIAIQGKATAPSKIESSATLDISASATLGLKGALININ